MLTNDLQWKSDIRQAEDEEVPVASSYPFRSDQHFQIVRTVSSQQKQINVLS